MNGWSEPYRKGYEEGFAKGQNEIVNKSLLEIKREAIQIGREIAEEEHKAMCDTCIHKVSAEDIKQIRADAIDEMANKLITIKEDSGALSIPTIRQIAEQIKEQKNE